MTTDSWNKRYATSKNLFGHSPNEFLVSYKRHLKPGMTALAIGDGEAQNGIWLARQGLDVTSVDNSQVAHETAKRHAKEAGVAMHIICSDILDYLSRGKKYDIIVHFFVHLPAPLKQDLHQKIINSLNPTGYVLFECFHKDQLHYGTGGPQDINMLYDEADIEREFSQLKIDTLQKSMTNVYEETRGSQPGVSLQFVGFNSRD